MYRAATCMAPRSDSLRSYHHDKSADKRKYTPLNAHRACTRHTGSAQSPARRQWKDVFRGLTRGEWLETAHPPLHHRDVCRRARMRYTSKLHAPDGTQPPAFHPAFNARETGSRTRTHARGHVRRARAFGVAVVQPPVTDVTFDRYVMR